MFAYNTDAIQAAVMPPFVILKNHFTEMCMATALISDDMMIQAAKETLLSVEDVRMSGPHKRSYL